MAPDGLLAATPYREWIEYYERHRVEGIAFGLIALRRQAAAAGQSDDALKPGFLKVARRLIEVGSSIPVD